ncbi:N-acetyltransferase ESCO2-like isoform X1 [Agrilus planipennis]|uniref:N-acetyltransferase ESCO2 isoform X1 n=3 Tax=Agrilus planipennis TaxID=224129 RepID=A0A1W4XSF9_AGRPL|nr:N-acetyltransferase ESCO2 isoform X1 [Agrilus planipennis]XP_025836624.1 N-acetyltransferase ESCO2-like isoform X1 [Agrilus planipennis]
MAEIAVDSVNELSHSSRISERRRALFPNDNDSDSDLGYMSPLRSDSSLSPPDSPLNQVHQRETMRNGLFKFDESSINDYVILGSVDNNTTNYFQCNISGSELEHTNSPFFTKHQDELSNSSLKIDTNETFIPDTPLKLSPVKNHQTPQESFNVSVKIPKLIRKSVDTGFIVQECGKRKLSSPESSPTSKYQKLEGVVSKVSRVRTTLFPVEESEVCVSPKSFYPKMENITTEKFESTLKNESKKCKPRSSQTFICNRRKKSRFGQINAGVRHKIRKPKQKRSSKSQVLKAALNILEKSPFNEYLQEMTNIQKTSTITPNMIKQIQTIKKNDPPLKNTSEIEPVYKHNPLSIDQENKKRELSPPPDNSKKFFKTTRTKAVVVINNSIKLNYDRGKLSLLENRSDKKEGSSSINFDLSDLISCKNDEILPAKEINSILDSLDDNQENISYLQTFNKDTESICRNENSKIILKADISVLGSANSIQLHNMPDYNKNNVEIDDRNDVTQKMSSSPTNISNINNGELFLSPTSQMCDMTSGLALNSPKKAIKNITTTLENLENQSTLHSNSCNYRPIKSIMEQKKLFPIFYGKATTSLDNQQVKIAVQNRNQNKTTWKKLPKDQMLLDAGQKRFGLTECHECKLVYHMGDPSEELLHLNYHNAGSIFRFNGWKNERVVENLSDGRIIKILPQDSKLWWRKVKDLLEIVNRELGIYELSFSLENVQVYLFIKNKMVQGCLVAEPKSKAYRMLNNVNGVDTCSEESFVIKCGVSRIWVSKTYRRRGIGSALMNCLKKTFFANYILHNNEIGFSGPTVDGKSFATKYFNTSNFLVYTD